MSRRRVYPLILTGILLGGVAYVGLHRGHFDVSELEAELRAFGDLAPILFVLVYAAGTVLFLPGSALTIAGGVMFGPVWGTLWNLSGATLGATLAFAIARYLASDWVAARGGERTARMMRGVEEEGWRFVAFVRLVPLFPFNLVNYAFGLTKVAIGEYILTTFVCMVPGAVAYTYVGYAGWQAASGQARALRATIVALALVTAVAFIPRLIRRLRGPRFTDAARLKEWLESGQNVSLIDVRSPEEFRGPLGHVCGSINIPISQLPERLPELTRTSSGPIITI